MVLYLARVELPAELVALQLISFTIEDNSSFMKHQQEDRDQVYRPELGFWDVIYFQVPLSPKTEI